MHRLLPLLLLTACKPDPVDSAPPLSSDCALGERTKSWAELCPDGAELLQYVDPMIGTGGGGNAVPGALVPHGMVKLSPDSQVEAGSIDAYEYDAERIEGFSHTHLEGPGGSANGYSNLLVLPFVGELPDSYKALASGFSHDNEDAAPGYYAVTLDEHGIRVELTASAFAGAHRYTFPASEDARIVVDLGHSRGSAVWAEWTASSGIVEGSASYSQHPLLTTLLADAPGSTAELTLYFSGEFSRPFDSQGVFTRDGDGLASEDGPGEISGEDVGGWLGWSTEEGEQIELRLGVSLQSVEQARANREAQVDGQSFEQVRAAAEAAWACALGRVQVEGGSEDQLTLLYTSLYRAMMQPSDLTEPNGSFVSGASGELEAFEACEGRSFYTDDWCMWDTFRTTHPLATLLEPETMDDRVASLLHLYQQGGWLPKCTWMSTGYSRVMIGNHAVPIMADALVKGFADYDQDLLWEAVHKSGIEEDMDFLVEGACGYFNLGTPPEYLEQGFVSHECDPSQSVSMTLEHAYDDWAAARIASLLGLDEQAAAYDLRAEHWRNHWDPDEGFMRGRYRDGSWVEDFDPQSRVDFCESNSWIYSFFVPHDVPGLVETMGGDEAFLERLDTFFDEGHFEPDNEPGFHVPFLYNHTSAVHGTQLRSRRLLADEYSAEHNGLPGNDDAGATSALYALAAMGLYPVAPGDGLYEITSPLFARIELALHDGGSFVISAPESSDEKLYIQSATLDGEALEEPRIAHERIVGGGTLELQMGPEPSDWGGE